MDNIIAKAIEHIVADFLKASCDLDHEHVILYSTVLEEEIKEVIQQIGAKFPRLKIAYQVFDAENKQCAVEQGDVGIRIPDELWSRNDGTFKCSFQSNLENVFGTLEFTVTTKEGVPSLDAPQIFSTVIGYLMPGVS